MHFQLLHLCMLNSRVVRTYIYSKRSQVRTSGTLCDSFFSLRPICISTSQSWIFWRIFLALYKDTTHNASHALHKTKCMLIYLLLINATCAILSFFFFWSLQKGRSIPNWGQVRSGFLHSKNRGTWVEFQTWRKRLQRVVTTKHIWSTFAVLVSPTKWNLCLNHDVYLY